MVPGAPDEARWVGDEARRTVTAADLDRMVGMAFQQSRIVEARPFAGGLRNANFRVRLDSVPEPIVLRVYEHDASLCQKELDLYRLVGGGVPVPEILYAAPNGWDGLPPFTISRYIEGISILDLKRSGDRQGLSQAAYSAGQTLAAVGRITFEKPGWLGPGPSVTAPLLEGVDPLPRFVDLCLASPNLERRLPAELRRRAHEMAWEYAPQFASLADDTRLVHGDFNKRNLLVRCTAGRWSVAVVLDWEFAVSGSPLADIGNFLRYERTSSPLLEPHFSAGYLYGGGTLPDNWRHLARLLDLAAVCESLTHAQLPDEIAAELIQLVGATVENRAPEMDRNSTPAGVRDSSPGRARRS